MKKILKYQIFLLGFTLFLTCFTSCQNDEEATHPIVGEWELINRETKSNINTEWTQMETCHLDDVETFSADGNWEKYLGTNWCQGQTKGSTKGKYTVNSTNNRVDFTYDNIPGQYSDNIIELNESSMIRIFNTGDVNNTQNRLSFRRR